MKPESLDSAALNSREFSFTRHDFDFVRNRLYEYCGIVLAEHKTDMVYARLSRRLRQLGLVSFAQYRQYFEQTPDELTLFANALTTNLTHFFREQHHFDFLAQHLIPQWLQEHAADQRVRLWSAGCSSGEEPYSLAMTLEEQGAALRNWDLRILATDLDTQMLDKARKGIYEADKLKDLPPARVQGHFVADKSAAGFQVKANLQDYIAFKQLNLMGDWPMRGPFDLIVCRNVVIYFDKPAQKRLFERFHTLLSPQGYLFLGHSESLGPVQGRFESVGRTMFRKREA